MKDCQNVPERSGKGVGALLSKFLIQLFSTTLICVMVFPGLLGGSITIRIHVCIMAMPGLLGMISECLLVIHAGLPERCCRRFHVKDYVFSCGVLPVEYFFKRRRRFFEYFCPSRGGRFWSISEVWKIKHFFFEAL